MQIFGVIPFIKLQNNIEITIKRCMVYTQHAMKQQQFHMAQVLWQPNNAVSTPLWWLFENTVSLSVAYD